MGDPSHPQQTEEIQFGVFQQCRYEAVSLREIFYSAESGTVLFGPRSSGNGIQGRAMLHPKHDCTSPSRLIPK